MPRLPSSRPRLPRLPASGQHRDSSLPGVTQQFHPNTSALAATEQCLSWAVGCPLPKSCLKWKLRPAEEQAFIQGHQGTLGRAGWGSLRILSLRSPMGSSLAKATMPSQSSQDVRQLQFPSTTQFGDHSLCLTLLLGKLRHTAKKPQEGCGVGKETLRIPGG